MAMQLLILGLVTLGRIPFQDPEEPQRGAWDREPADSVASFQPSRLRLGLENVEVSSREQMGLYGLHYDLLEIWDALPGLYAGPGGFGAVSGRRGGFFVGGFNLGYRLEWLAPFVLEAGGFVGGGGGGNAPQGSGLMLRTHLALEVDLEALATRIEVSQVDFPDGGIDSLDLAFGVTVPLGMWTAGGATKGQGFDRIDPLQAAAPHRASLLHVLHDPDADARRTDGRALTQTLGMIGIRLDWFLDEEWFASLQLGGALAGEVDGFAQMLGGIGYQLPIGEGLALEARLQVGAAGGGQVETGGGYLVQPALGARVRLDDHLSAAASVGRTLSPGGDFDATSFEFGLAMESRPLALRPQDAGRLLPNGAELARWRIHVFNKTYWPDSSARAKNGSPLSPSLQLLGLGFDRPLTSWLSGTGQAIGAWDGDIGGYAEGLFGLEFHHAPWPSCEAWELTARVLLGAAGGGGVDLGSGFLWEAEVGTRIRIAQDWGLSVDFGRIQGFAGNFEAEVLRLGLSLDFAQPLAP